LKFKDIFLIPNLITISRLLITIYIFISTSADEFIIANLVLLIALIGISDSVDGIVARKLNQVSNLGTILDPITDRIVFVLLIFWLSSFFNPIFLILLIIREILVSLGGLYVLKTEKTVKVTNKGKLGTALIFISICLGILNKDINTVFIDLFMYISLIFYYFVALEYLYKLNKKNE
tara:strand:+ start:986 stop:1516 length:531 start_codon:yes stop_codon:yes gene_type:complete